MNKKLNIVAIILLIIGLSAIIYRLMIPEQISADGIVSDNLYFIILGLWTIVSSLVIFGFNILISAINKNHKKITH